MTPENHLSAEEVSTIAKSLELINSSFDVIREGETSEINFKRFEAFSNYRHIYPHLLFFLSNSKSKPFVTFTQVEYYVGGKRNSSCICREYQVWAGVKLKSDFGNIQIRNETARDKVNELFYPEEVEFDYDPDFCNKFFVVTDNHIKAQQLLTNSIRQEIKNIPFSNLQIEVKGSTLIVGNRKAVIPKEALQMAQFVYSFSENIG